MDHDSGRMAGDDATVREHPPPPASPPTGPAPRPLRWFQTAWGGPALSVLCMVVWLIASQIVPAVVAAIAVLAAHEWKMPADQLTAELLALSHVFVALGLVVSLILAVVLWKIGWLAPPPPGWRGRRPLPMLGGVAALSVLCLAGQYVIGRAMAWIGIEPREQEAVLALLENPTVAIIVAFVVLAPIAEEVLLRRIVFGTLSRSNGRLVAYIGSGVLFALIHLNPTVIPGYVWMACCFAAAYELTGSTWGAIAVHGVNNFVATGAHVFDLAN